jgi:hypothetical protein
MFPTSRSKKEADFRKNIFNTSIGESIYSYGETPTAMESILFNECLIFCRESFGDLGWLLLWGVSVPKIKVLASVQVAFNEVRVQI